MSININIPHRLGREEARRRIAEGFLKIVRLLPGGAGNCVERWDGDQLTFSVVSMGQSISGVVRVSEAVVEMEIELPGVLGLVAGGLTSRLRKAGTLLLK